MKKIDLNEIALNTRRTWGSVKPASKAFKTKAKETITARTNLG